MQILSTSCPTLQIQSYCTSLLSNADMSQFLEPRLWNRRENQGVLKHFYFSSPLGFSVGFCHQAAQAFLPLEIKICRVITLALSLSYCIYYFITDFRFLCMSKQNSMTPCLPSGLTARARERLMQPNQQYFDFTEDSSLCGNRYLCCMWFAVSVLVFSCG